MSRSAALTNQNCPTMADNLQPSEIAGLTLNALVIVMFAERMIRKTPRNLNFSKWSRPKQYEFTAFTSVIINQICYFIIIVLKPSTINTDLINVLGNITVWITSTCLVFGSLYRYERLLTVLRGTWQYQILQILRYTSVVVAILAAYGNIHYRYLTTEDNKTLVKYIHGIFDFLSILLSGIIDLSSNIIMTNAVLYSLPRKINERARFAVFKRQLWALMSIEIIFSVISAIFYILGGFHVFISAYIHLSLLAICPVYVTCP